MKFLGSVFIMMFILLLIVCAFSLIFGQEPSAKRIANWAFLFLAVGVIIKIFQFFREA